MKDCPGRGKHGIFWFSFIFSYQCSALDHWATTSPFYSFFHRTIQTRWHLSADALRNKPWCNLYKLSCKGCSQLRTCKLVAAENIPNFAAAVRSPLENKFELNLLFSNFEQLISHSEHEPANWRGFRFLAL